MGYVLIGTLAFVFFFFFDVYTLKNQRVKKRFYGIIGVGVLVYLVVMVTVNSIRIDFPIPLRIAAFVFWVGITFLLIYSLFLEIPFVKTYAKKQQNNELVKNGTYALCRHPGVLWFGLSFLFFFYTIGAVLLIPAGIVWTSVDVLYVYLQEKLIFYKIFPDYKDYVKITPMLIPTKVSIKKCISTLF